jgi:hypothetical protein
MLDIWVCGECHSVNRERADRCYKCRAPRVASATGQGSVRREERALVARLTSPVRSSLELGVLAALLILLVIGLEVRTTLLELDALPRLRAVLEHVAATNTYEPGSLDTAVASVNESAIPTVLAFFAALLAFAAWLALGVSNMPGLGGGEPSVSPMYAFVSAIIPVLNFRRVPRILQEIVYRSDPRGGGILILALAWIGVVGSWILLRVVGLYINTRIETDAINSASVAEFAKSLQSIVDLGVAFDIAFTALIVVGALALIVVMAVVERRTAARNREIEAALAEA